MVRGKKRIGYELEVKVNFEGQGPKKGNDFSFRLQELCDDGSDPSAEFHASKESTKQKNKGVDGKDGLKQEIIKTRVLDEFIEKCKDILKQIQDSS